MSLSISPNNANRLIIAFVTGSGEPFILRFCLIAMILTFFFMSCSTSKTNLRASDMLGIKVHQVKDLKPNDEIVLNEKKTKKERRITLNRACISAIRGLLASKKYTDEDFLFTGQRGVLTVPTVNQKVKSWCRTINLKGNFGGHTLRKTFGYHQRVSFGTDLPTLMEIFNHSTQKQTLSYLCVQPDEIKNVYENEL